VRDIIDKIQCVKFLSRPDEESNRAAFQLHFNSQLSHYANVTVISLVDQVGKEKVIADAFLSHILTYNHSELTYISFDFHEYWLVDTCRRVLLTKSLRFSKNLVI